MKYLPEKSTIQILRDCLKLVPHMTNKNNIKNNNIRSTIIREFRRNKIIDDKKILDNLRFKYIYKCHKRSKQLSNLHS